MRINHAPIPPSTPDDSPQEPGEPPDRGPTEGLSPLDPDEPVPTSRALVPRHEHQEKPGYYRFVLFDNDDVSELHRNRVIRHFLGASVHDFPTLEFALRTRRQIVLGPDFYEVVESRAVLIGRDGLKQGYHFDMVLEKL